MSESSTPMPTLAQFRHTEPLRIRWAEVDMQGIVFNGHYLTYFDTVLTGYWRALGMPYQATMDQLGGDLYVRKATLEYLGSARFDERCDMAARCLRIGTSSLLMQPALFRDGRLLVLGEMVYVFADPHTQTSKPVPDALRALIHAFEAGEPMFDVRLGSWDAMGPQAAPLRHAVFVQEQGIAAALEGDGADAAALHAVALNRLGRAVATGRLLPAVDGVAKVGRMAVHARIRGAGLGARVLALLMEAARARGDRQVQLHAQKGAVGFYRRLGFAEEGLPFTEAGVEHQALSKAL